MVLITQSEGAEPPKLKNETDLGPYFSAEIEEAADNFETYGFDDWVVPDLDQANSIMGMPGAVYKPYADFGLQKYQYPNRTYYWMMVNGVKELRLALSRRYVVSNNGEPPLRTNADGSEHPLRVVRTVPHTTPQPIPDDLPQ